MRHPPCCSISVHRNTAVEIILSPPSLSLSSSYLLFHSLRPAPSRIQFCFPAFTALHVSPPYFISFSFDYYLSISLILTSPLSLCSHNNDCIFTINEMQHAQEYFVSLIYRRDTTGLLWLHAAATHLSHWELCFGFSHQHTIETFAENLTRHWGR